jgi:uncharacterized membrane protein
MTAFALHTRKTLAYCPRVTTHSPTVPVPAGSARWLALDVFRALAVLWMIQGHTFTALLGTTDSLGQVYRLMHGLTAPMFLCGAGLAYGIVHFSAHKPVVPGRMLRRALLLWVIGTVLQLPAAPLWSILWQRELLSAVVQPGALQLVAACLALAELLRAASAGRAQVFARSAAVLGVSVVLVSPCVWGVGLSQHYVLGSWFDGLAGAQFPLLPWLSFFLIGVAISAGWGTRLWLEPSCMPRLGATGLGASALCYALFLSGERLHGVYGAHAFWFTSPMFVVFRAGLVLAWLGLLSHASSGIARSLVAWPGVALVVSKLSRHSLVAYVVHLSLLYGVPLRGGAYSLLECSIACAVVVCISVLSVLHWERVRAFFVALASDRAAAENERGVEA